MPVRSNGRLLAGAGAVLALCVAGSGCQTQAIRPPTLMPATPAVVASSASPASVEVAPAPTVIASTPPPACRFTFFRRPRPTAEIQAPVADPGDRLEAAAQGNAVIASSWRAIERSSPGQGPAVEAPATTVVATEAPLQQIGGSASDNRPADTTWRPAGVTAGDPPATIASVSTQTTSTDLAPAPRLVPQAVTPQSPVIARASYHYPAGVHGAAAGVAPVVPAVPREFEKQSLPPYVVEPPDILLINASNAITLPTQPLLGQHLVRPDGTLNLGIYGSVFVAGLTLDQIQDSIASVLKARHAKKKGEDGKPTDQELTVEDIKLELQVDVLAYNSKVYYIITDGGGYGEQVYRISATGNETVLDALSQINGLPAVASKKRIWVARATPDHAPPMILPVDWCGIVKNGSAATNYQIFPGDRVYVNSDARIRADSALGKLLAPAERVLGTVLLGSSAVNSIKSGGLNGSSVP
jgi:polysaccharide export outer membrane protein